MENQINYSKELDKESNKESYLKKGLLTRIGIYSANYIPSLPIIVNSVKANVGNPYGAISNAIIDFLGSSEKFRKSEEFRLTKRLFSFFYVGACAYDLYCALHGDTGENLGKATFDGLMIYLTGKDAYHLYEEANLKPGTIEKVNTVSDLKKVGKKIKNLGSKISKLEDNAEEKLSNGLNKIKGKCKSTTSGFLNYLK